MPETQNSFLRMAVAMEQIAAGAGKPLKGRSYTFDSEDKLILAVRDVVAALGGEVADA